MIGKMDGRITKMSDLQKLMDVCDLLQSQIDLLITNNKRQGEIIDELMLQHLTIKTDIDNLTGILEKLEERTRDG